jgi:hypothetical protein
MKLSPKIAHRIPSGRPIAPRRASQNKIASRFYKTRLRRYNLMHISPMGHYINNQVKGFSTNEAELTIVTLRPKGRLIFFAEQRKFREAQEKSGAQGAFSFGYFSLGEQRKVTMKI